MIFRHPHPSLDTFIYIFIHYDTCVSFCLILMLKGVIFPTNKKDPFGSFLFSWLNRLDYPSHTRALRNIRIQAPSSCHWEGYQEFCTARNTRSG